MMLTIVKFIESHMIDHNYLPWVPSLQTQMLSLAGLDPGLPELYSQ